MQHEGGTRPHWNETFEIRVESLDDTIKFACCDEDGIIDDVVGETVIRLRDMCSQAAEAGAGYDQWVTLKHRDNVSAKIHLKASYQGPLTENWPNDPNRVEPFFLKAIK